MPNPEKRSAPPEEAKKAPSTEEVRKTTAEIGKQVEEEKKTVPEPVDLGETHEVEPEQVVEEKTEAVESQTKPETPAKAPEASMEVNWKEIYPKPEDDPVFQDYDKQFAAKSPQARGEYLTVMAEALENDPLSERAKRNLEAFLKNVESGTVDMDFELDHPLAGWKFEVTQRTGDEFYDLNKAEKAAASRKEGPTEMGAAPASAEQAGPSEMGGTLTEPMKEAAQALNLTPEQLGDLKKSFDYMMRELGKKENEFLKSQLVGEGKPIDFTWEQFMQAPNAPEKKSLGEKIKGIFKWPRKFGSKFETVEPEGAAQGWNKMDMWERMAEAYQEFARGASGTGTTINRERQQGAGTRRTADRGKNAPRKETPEPVDLTETDRIIAERKKSAEEEAAGREEVRRAEAERSEPPKKEVPEPVDFRDEDEKKAA